MFHFPKLVYTNDCEGALMFPLTVGRGSLAFSGLKHKCFTGYIAVVIFCFIEQSLYVQLRSNCSPDVIQSSNGFL